MSKPLNIKNYGSIPHLSNSKLGTGDHFIEKGQERILTEKPRDKHDVIIVTEKYDGSNVGIAKKNGKILSLTRSGYEAHTSPYIQHHKFSEWVISNKSLFDIILNEGERITGEWLIQAHGIKYDIDRRLQPIVFFDYFNSKNERLPFEHLDRLYRLYNIQIPRLLHKGNSITVDELLPILNKKTYGIIPEEKPEGMVYRVERKEKVDFLAKWVRKDFEPGKYCIGIEEQNLIWNTNNV